MVVTKKKHDYSKKVFSTEQKEAIAKMASASRGGIKKVAEKYNISFFSVKKFVRCVKDGIRMKSKGGRPSRLEKEDKEIIVAKMKESTFHMSTESFTKLVNDVAKESHIKRGMPICSFKPLSKRVIKRLEDELKIHTGKAEVVTDARAKAVADIRNAISFAAANAYMDGIVEPPLKINGDATQFKIISGNNGDVQVQEGVA
jgi:transposase-like protein